MTALAPITSQELVHLGASSLISFGQIFMPRTMRQDSPQMHYAIGTALYSLARYNAFEVFRGGAKTSLLRVFTAQRIAYGISRTIMYVSVSQSHSIHSIRWLKKQIEYNKLFCDIFGLRKGSKWTDEIIEIFHGVEETPITIMAMGITGQIRGFNIDDYRPDLIIADDVCSEENTATPEQRKKLSDLFFGALVNSLAPESEAPSAKIVLLQTPLHPEDLVETCMKDPQWNGLRFSILTDAGESQWAARFPLKEILAEKEAAIRRGQFSLWMREKECKLVRSEDQTFDVTKLHYYDILPDGLYVILSIDPASSDSVKADDNVVMAVGFRGNDIYILDYHADQGVMPDATAAHFFQLALMYRPAKAAVETVHYQRVLKWYLEQEMVKRRTFITIDSFADRRKKTDRIIQTISGLLSFGHIHCRASHTKLVQQLQDFDPQVEQHDDVIDALSIAITAVNPAIRGQIMEDVEFEMDNGTGWERDRYGELVERQPYRGAP